MEAVLTKEDKKYINDNFDKKFERFAILIQNSFSELGNELREDINNFKRTVQLDLGSMRSDLVSMRHDLKGLENRLISGPNRRLDKVEDDVRVIKSSLKIK